VLVLEDQRFHAEHVLVMAQSVHDHWVVTIIGHGDYHHVAWTHSRNNFLVKLGETPARRFRQGGMRREILTRKSIAKLPIVLQRLQRRGVRGADTDLADDTDSLKVVQRRKEQITRDHSSAHDRHIKACGLLGHGNTSLRRAWFRTFSAAWF
jgi:hypothetical protein